jgi:hypothetical protein
VAFQVDPAGQRAGFNLTVQFGEVDLETVDTDGEDPDNSTYDFIASSDPVYLSIEDGQGPGDDLGITSQGLFQADPTSGVAAFDLNSSAVLDLGDGRTGRLVTRGDACLGEGQAGSQLFINGGFAKDDTAGEVRARTGRESVYYVWGFISGVLVIDPYEDGVPCSLRVYGSAAEGETRAGLLPFAGPACTLSNGEQQAKCDRLAARTAAGRARRHVRHRRRGADRRAGQANVLRSGRAILKRHSRFRRPPSGIRSRRAKPMLRRMIAALDSRQP